MVSQRGKCGNTKPSVAAGSAATSIGCSGIGRLALPLVDSTRRSKYGRSLCRFCTSDQRQRIRLSTAHASVRHGEIKGPTISAGGQQPLDLIRPQRPRSTNLFAPNLDAFQRGEGLRGIVSHDVKKFMHLLLKKNGYVLEQLYSPLIVHTTPEHAELKSIAHGCITRHHSHHYFGFAETQWKLLLKESPRRVKPLLYVYRVLLTGICG
jgi:hypothetical protein